MVNALPDGAQCSGYQLHRVDKNQIVPVTTPVPLPNQILMMDAMRKAILAFTSFTFLFNTSHSQNPLPNAGFEEWNNFTGGLQSTYREPVGWNSANQCSELIGTYSISRTEDSHSGTYAAELRTRNAFIGSVRINGLMSTADVICGVNTGGIDGGIASDLIPDSVVFWYKYIPAGVDTAYVQVMLLSGDDTLSYVKGQIHETVNVWTRASFPIPAPTGTPSVISTAFNSSWGDGSQGQAVTNSNFKVDDVEFVFATGINENMEANVDVYPNPMTDALHVRLLTASGAQFEMLDATGRTVISAIISQMDSRIDVSRLPQGMYIYQVRGMDNVVLRTGKLMKGR